MISTLFRASIERTARRHFLSADLVEALVITESSGQPYAWNPEPRYRYFWDVKRRAPFRLLRSEDVLSKFPPSDFPAVAGDPDQEWWGQQASWGLMQIMGALARERGFSEPFLPALCDVEHNLDVGCGHLSDLIEWSEGDVPKALGAYNAGRGAWMSEAGQRYANKVDAKRRQIEVSRL